MKLRLVFKLLIAYRQTDKTDDSSVSIVTELGNRRIVVRFPTGVSDPSFLQTVHTDGGSLPASCPVGNLELFPQG